MALPEFFVAGAPKAGTTALHAALSRHPDLYLSAVKEPKFFLTDGPPPARGGPGDARTYREHVWRRADYEAPVRTRVRLVPCAASRPRSTSTARARSGGSGPSIPDARLIVVLRDPVERAHSNWTHLWSAGLDPVGDFVAACAAEDRRVAAGWADFWHYTRLGRYGEQLEHLYSVFPREQVLVLRYRAMIAEPDRVLDTVCAFLGVRQGLLSEVPRENVTAHPPSTARHRSLARLLRAGSALTTVSCPAWRPRASRTGWNAVLQSGAQPRQPLTWEQRSALLPRFETDIRLLESLTGEDFSAWLAPRASQAAWSGPGRPVRCRPGTAGRGRADRQFP